MVSLKGEPAVPSLPTYPDGRYGGKPGTGNLGERVKPDSVYDWQSLNSAHSINRARPVVAGEAFESAVSSMLSGNSND